jgi:hypothetical protein
MTATEGYEATTWRRRVLRVVARDHGWTDREVARIAFALSDEDLRRHLRQTVAIIEAVKGVREIP